MVEGVVVDIITRSSVSVMSMVKSWSFSKIASSLMEMLTERGVPSVSPMGVVPAGMKKSEREEGL